MDDSSRLSWAVIKPACILTDVREWTRMSNMFDIENMQLDFPFHFSAHYIISLDPRRRGSTFLNPQLSASRGENMDA